MKANDTVIPALNMAVKKRLNGILAPGLIFHSDRDVHYTCKEFVGLLDKYKMVRNNSLEGNCWDNAVAGSFFKTHECEFVYHFKNFISAEKMRSEIFRYIEIWYNRKIRHSFLMIVPSTEIYCCGSSTILSVQVE